MSEPMFPGTGGTAAPAPAPVQTGEKSNRKTLLMLGGVLAALVVGGGAFMFMNSSGGDDAALAPVVPRPVASAPSAAPTAAPTPTPVVKPASVTVAKRDPFAPLFPTPTATTDPTPDASTPVVPGGGATPPVPPVAPVIPVTLDVKAIDTNAQVATVSVDGKKYPKLGVGDSFGGHYTLYSVFNAQCVGVLFGDQSVPVCLGKPVSITP